MRCVPITILVLALAGWPAGARAADGEAVAVVDRVHAITRAEIDAAVAPQLRKLAAEEEQIRLEVLQQLIDEKLLAAEAGRRGVTVEALLADVTAKASPVAAEALAKRVADVRAKRPDLGEQEIEEAARATLLRANERAARDAFLAALAEKAGVHIALEPSRVAIATAGRPALGPSAAPVTIVVFSDFQCPYCSETARVLREVQRLESADVRLVYRHFPLSIHDRAERAAEAAECASQSGKFWPMHDALFANARKLSDGDLAAYAVAAGVDRDAFAQCLSSGVARLAIEADERDAREAGVEGTPAIFINGRRVTGPRTVEALRRLIAQERPRPQLALTRP